MRSRTFLLAVMLFFCSGALGLGYELVWIRKAALVVGASQIALSTVLTSFFLGLGLGSYFVGRYLRSSRWSPLFVYGLFEVAIGLFALSFPWLFELLEMTYSALYGLCAGSGFLLFALRFLLLFLLCLVPTFFMGGTLPLLLDGLVDRDRSVGSRTSFLYGVNILGAVVGVLVTCYWAIPQLGMNGTSLVGGAGNLTIGLLAVIAFGRLRPIHAEEKQEPLELFFPLAAFASGLLAIGYQIVWARYFTLFHTTTVYITALLLAVFLLALAVGSFVLAPLLQARMNPLRIVSVVQALVPVAALYMLGWWRLADRRLALHAETLEVVPTYKEYWMLGSESATTTFYAPLFQISLVIFLPVVLIGTGLPALIAAATRHASGLRSASGRVVFWNTLGSSAGGFVAGYALLPLIGLHWTLSLLGLGSLGLSVAARIKLQRTRAEAEPAGRQERRHGEAPNRAPRWIGYVLPSLCFLAVLPFVLLGEDVTRHTVRDYGYGRDLGISESMELVEVLEGPLTTAFVFEDEKSVQVGAGNVCLAVAYKGSFSTQAFQGHIPCLFYPGAGTPENCLGICLGSGQSFGALLLYDIKHLDVVDISGEMIDVCLRRYAPFTHGLQSDPRVSFHLDDGRHFVERADDAVYDVISMEPPPPTADGVYSLYSLEFYEEVRRTLRPGGVFMQWLPLYRVTPNDTRGILRTQSEVFPDTFVVKVGLDDFMIVSYLSEPRWYRAAIRERAQKLAKEWQTKSWNVERWSRGCRHDMYSLEGVLSLLVMGPDEVRAAAQDGIVYHDDNQILSYSSGDRSLLYRYEGRNLSRLSFAALRLTPFQKLGGNFDPVLSPAEISDLTVERAASLGFYEVPSPLKVQEELSAWERANTDEYKAQRALALAQLFDRVLQKDEAYSWIEKALDAWPQNSSREHQDLVRGIVRNRVAVYGDTAEKWIERLSGKFPGAPLVVAMRAQLENFRKPAPGA